MDSARDAFDPARRAFLRGRLPASAVSISVRCLAANSVICRTCEEICDAGAVSFAMRAGAIPRPTIDLDRCTRCGDCVPACPAAAITVTPRTEAGNVA